MSRVDSEAQARAAPVSDGNQSARRREVRQSHEAVRAFSRWPQTCFRRCWQRRQAHAVAALHRFGNGCGFGGHRGRRNTVWSPDSRWVGFSANGKLQKMEVTGGSQPQVICDIEGRAGGTWNQDGVILFDQGGKPIQRLSAAGGTPTSVFPLDASRGEAAHLAPYFLPDGQHFLYYSGGKSIDSKFASLDGKVNRVIMEKAERPDIRANPRGGGWLVYNVRGQLLARPFDPVKGEFTGPSAVIASGVGNGRWWYASTKRH